MEKITIKTTKRNELVDITKSLQAIVAKDKIKEGLCVIFCPHTTAGLTINENADPAVQSDMIKTLARIIPADDGYTHSEGNSDSHIKASLFGQSLNIIISAGKLQLGVWQGVYFCECDGPRNREVWAKILEE